MNKWEVSEHNFFEISTWGKAGKMALLQEGEKTIAFRNQEKKNRTNIYLFGKLTNLINSEEAWPTKVPKIKLTQPQHSHLTVHN